MAKIHKSTSVILDSNKPVLVDRPDLGPGLRQSMRQGADRRRQEERLQSAVEKEAQRILDSAQEKAKDLIDTARQEAFEIRKEAYAKAVAKAQKELDQEKRKIQDACSQALDQLQARQDSLLSSLEPQALKLSLAVAEKIIGKALDDDPQAFIEMTRQAIASLQQQSKIIIRISETDYWHSLAAQNQERFDPEKVSFVKDESLPRGSLEIEGSFGSLDASVQSQLGKLRDHWEVSS